MRYALLILFFVVLVLPQFPGNPEKSESSRGSSGPVGTQPLAKHAPILGFAANNSATPIMDTDLSDQQKYMKQGGSDDSILNAKRASHEAALTRELVDGFNQAEECDGINLLGRGDNKPDFALQVTVDSHDTPSQKPVWNWILRDVHTDKLLPAGNDASGQQAAKRICSAVWKLAKG